MRLIELLESRSADLYHGTNLSNVNRILQDNVLVANTSIHNADVPSTLKGYTKTVSLARSPAVATTFARSSAVEHDSAPVVLVLDQDKLHRKLGKRMRPYDDLPSMHGIGSNPRSKGTSETEEAVYGSINNINDYIKKIIVHKPSNPSKEHIAQMAQYKRVMNDPRTIVVDFLNKNLTGRQFLQLYKDSKNA